MPKDFAQRGFAPIFIVLIVLAGLSSGLYLVQQKTGLFTKAFSSQGAKENSQESLQNVESNTQATPTSKPILQSAYDRIFLRKVLNPSPSPTIIQKPTQTPAPSSLNPTIHSATNTQSSPTPTPTPQISDNNQNSTSNNPTSTPIPLTSTPTQNPTSTPTPTATPTPVASVSCSSGTFGMYIKFQDITANGPSLKYVNLSFKQPTSNNELWRFDSVPATNNISAYFNYTNGDIYRVAFGTTACGTYDIYVSSTGYQEKKFTNILVDDNPWNDPETYIFQGQLIPQ